MLFNPGLRMALALALASFLFPCPALSHPAVTSRPAQDARNMLPDRLDNAPAVCEYYNATCVAAAAAAPDQLDARRCYGNRTCDAVATGGAAGHSCFAVWQNNDPESDLPPEHAEAARPHLHPTKFNVKMMGCYTAHKECLRREECLEEDHEEDFSSGHLFCCCVGDMCNSRFRWLPPVTPLPGPSSAEDPDSNQREQDGGASKGTLAAAVAVSALVVVLAVLALVTLYVYRKRKLARENIMANLNGGIGGAGGDGPPSPHFLQKPIDLLELKGGGRFGKVYKAKLENEEVVAVKAFPLSEKQSFEAEKVVYSLPRLSHENILKFIGVSSKGAGVEKEFYLITEFHSTGSLHDYLKSSTVSWNEMCKIAHSISRGLAHLHEELLPKGQQDMKLAVAHRDFKSKNVLLKEDLTACIGDFGLALIFEPDKEIADTGQVGTKRYMAPEVLDGAITYSRESFLRIDMYACGLVLWELASRCSIPGPGGVVAREYELPFEGRGASVEEMKEIVVNRKERPPIPDSWNGNTGMQELGTIIRDCWDQDAEARRSAANVVEKIDALRRLQQQQVQPTEEEVNEDEEEEEDAGGGSEVEEAFPLTPEQRLNNANCAPREGGGGHEEHELTPLIVNGHAAAQHQHLRQQQEQRDEVPSTT